VSLIEEEQLDLSMHLIASVPDRHWHLDLTRLYLDVVKNAACLIPRSTDELTRDRKVLAEFTDCVRQVILQSWVF
jgi:hypothetical protein